MLNNVIKIVKQLKKGKYHSLNPNDENWLEFYEFYEERLIGKKMIKKEMKIDFSNLLKLLKRMKKEEVSWEKMDTIINNSSVCYQSKDLWRLLVKYLNNELELKNIDK